MKPTTNKKAALDIKALLPYLKGSYLSIFLSFIFATISVGAKMAIPFVSGLAIEKMKNGDFEIMGHLYLILIFIAVGALFRYLFDYVTSFLAQKVVKRMRDQLFNSLVATSIGYIDTHEHGDLLLRLINDIENVQTGLITGVGALYEGAVQILITLVFMFMLNWLLALTVILLTPISVVVSKFISSRNAKYFRAQNKSMGELTAFSLESITNIEAIQSYGLEESKEEKFESLNSGVKSSNFKALFAASWINPSTRLVNNTIYASIIFLGALLLMHVSDWSLVAGGFTVGALSSFLTYSYQYMTPFNEIADAAMDVFYASASLERINETIHAKKDVDEGKMSLGKSIDTLEAKDMNFSYDGKRMIIKDFNLDVYKGHKIALVGPTGCGKTTVINLLMRFYDSQTGGFYMNGIDSKLTPKQEMRSHIGMVLQETWLERGTIAQNIAFGKPEASMEEIVAAAKKAHADEFIRRMPKGYDSIVSNASGMSMGEKQLLCVARIMLMEPEIVLLDEATSNIDLRTELALAGAFDELMKGKTSLVVAHRLSTIKNSDLILVMKDGEIMEQGNFKQLMDKNGFFADLYRSQLA